MDGFHIILYPEDRSWIAMPDFIRGLAGLLGADKLESLRIYRETAASLNAELSGHEGTQKILERQNVSVEEGIALQRTGTGYCTHLKFDEAAAFADMMDAVGIALPEELSEGWTPLEVSFCNGEQVHYCSNDGERLDRSGCHLTLSNYLGYPVEMDDYLEAFLEVDAFQRFRQRLEELSSCSWIALIDLA